MSDIAGPGAVVLIGLFILYGWLRWIAHQERNIKSLEAIDYMEKRIDERIYALINSNDANKNAILAHDGVLESHFKKIAELKDNIHVVHRDLAELSKMTMEEINRLKGRDSMRALSSNPKGTPF